MDHPTGADSTPTQTPTLPRREPPADAELGRFSPLTAPQREAVDQFVRESRPWALRQARRSYRHLPESLREQAVDRACTELRSRAPRSLERRVLSAELAERLTESLRHVHVGWCLNESSALLRRDGTEPVQPEVRREDLAQFVDEGLGGLERAVLQLEIGAGRDTRTARAALRLGARQYSSHREAGLSKLRDAISAQIIGRACDQHVSSIVAAATGDKASMEALTAGPHRCRFCAREAQGLRSVLHERLAVAPWPIVIAPMGALAAKLGAAGAVLGGKAAAGGGGIGALGAGGSGASAAATVLAVAALATGSAALIDGGGERQAESAPKIEQASGASKSSRPAEKPAAQTAAVKEKGRKPRRRDGGGSGRSGGSSDASGGTPSSTPSTPAVAAAPAAPSGGGEPPVVASEPPAVEGPVTEVTKPVTDTVDETVDQVTDVIEPVLDAPVDEVVDSVTDTVDDTTGAVDGVLNP